ncbi:hypothetical protein Btru_050374 [Bulinus truncatus]|nr:hypothetical protein Btru_050374 [Bulinus truncatus]
MFKGKNVILVFQNILDLILAMGAPSVIAQQVVRWITVVMIMATVTCNCNPNGGAGKVCDMTTGLCQCLPRVEGSTCSQSCTCMSLPGSTGNCNSSTGVCECLPGVFGSSCDQCIDMYFNITEKIGCQPCDCSLNGSSSSICDKSTGQCVCREMVSGRTCSQCQNGYWNVHQISGCDGSFPDCVLCGECLDSRGNKINIIGQHLTEMDAVVTSQGDQAAIMIEMNSFNYTSLNLQTNLNSLLLLTDAVNVTSTTTTSGATLRQQLDNLAALIESAQNLGNASYMQIQALAFVVASPENKLQKLKDQAKQSMDLAAAINQTYSMLSMFTNDVDAASGILLTLVAESTKARSDMLDVIMLLERFVANSSSVQRLAEKVLRDAKNFKSVAEKSEQTMINSFTALLECIIALNQAKADLTSAQLRSLSVTQVQLPSLNEMLSLVQQIEKSSVKTAGVTEARRLNDCGQNVQRLWPEGLTTVARRLNN